MSFTCPTASYKDSLSARQAGLQLPAIQNSWRLFHAATLAWHTRQSHYLTSHETRFCSKIWGLKVMIKREQRQRRTDCKQGWCRSEVLTVVKMSIFSAGFKLCAYLWVDTSVSEEQCLDLQGGSMFLWDGGMSLQVLSVRTNADYTCDYVQLNIDFLNIKYLKHRYYQHNFVSMCSFSLIYAFPFCIKSIK